MTRAKGTRNEGKVRDLPNRTTMIFLAEYELEYLKESPAVPTRSPIGR